MRYFGLQSMDEINRMTYAELRLRTTAFNLRSVDEEFKAHRLAWLVNLAGAKKSSGKYKKPVYRTFKEFYDYDAAIKEAKDPDRRKEHGSVFDRVVAYRRRKEHAELQCTGTTER